MRVVQPPTGTDGGKEHQEPAGPSKARRPPETARCGQRAKRRTSAQGGASVTPPEAGVRRPLPRTGGGPKEGLLPPKLEEPDGHSSEPRSRQQALHREARARAKIGRPMVKRISVSPWY